MQQRFTPDFGSGVAAACGVVTGAAFERGDLAGRNRQVDICFVGPRLSPVPPAGAARALRRAGHRRQYV